MKRFTALFTALDETTSTNGKVDALVRYFESAPPPDAAWAVYFLTGRRLKRLVSSATIRTLIVVESGIPAWLIDECYAAVGDGAEAAALLFDSLSDVDDADDTNLARWIDERIVALRSLRPEEQGQQVARWARTLDRTARLVFLKLLTGELRLGVSQTLVVRALARVSGTTPPTIAARLAGDWHPSPEWFVRLISSIDTDRDLSRPYPFCLAAPLDGIELEGMLGELSQWAVEWKWDGIRAQVVKRSGRVFIWSRGDELVTDRFPEIVTEAGSLPDGTVIDGEVLAFRDERPLPFSALQRRIARKVGIERTARDIPVRFMAFDILEHHGKDLRGEVLRIRRGILEAVLHDLSTIVSRQPRTPAAVPLLPFEIEGDTVALQMAIQLSPAVRTSGWQELASLRLESRARGVEGLMLKRLDSLYEGGRRRGTWWKWKIAPLTVDAVLLYAQPGSGKRASLLTDYTFGVWWEGELVPVAKAYSGLSNVEIAELDAWIRRHTVERFGPVRHVEPEHVFELGFEAVASSTRHRSGVALRFPRMLRWRKDKRIDEADTLQQLRDLIRRS